MHILLALLSESSALPLLQEFEVEINLVLPNSYSDNLKTDVCARFRRRPRGSGCYGCRAMRTALSTLHPTMYFIVVISCKGVEWYVSFALL